MKRLLLIFALVAVAFSGCMEREPSTEQPGAEQPSADEIKALMIDSVNNLDSYKFDTESTQQVEVFNRSTEDGNVSTITVTSVGEGAVDLAGRAMGMVQSLNIESENNNATSGKSETYILNDTLYLSADGNWTSLKLPNADLIWDRQNMVKNQAELLNNSKIELLGSENVDGQDTYKVKVVPDMETYSAVLSEQVGSILPVAALNLTEIYRNSSTEWTSWITKDAHLLKKNEIRMNLTVTPEIMGMPENEVGDFEMRINAVATTIFSDFNQPVEIILPEGAKNATVMTLLPAPVNPQAAT
ncbi:MAG TPA: DUF6612 family protein [Methanotrichaceae archaeon]|nr:DUF6612 family protein [Methanotrichaceae archaeon]